MFFDIITQRGDNHMEKAKVYFTKDLSSESLIKMFKILDKELKGSVAIKLHTGEKGNQNFLTPEYVKPLVDFIGGTVVECNTAYEGARNSTEKHKKLIKERGWSDFKFDLMDENDDDLELQIKNHLVIDKNYVGSHMKNYDSMLVLSHFKGHPMGGFGGALKQLSIGCASSRGKTYIHSAGRELDQTKLWDNLPKQDLFLESMADAASSVVEFFKGNMAFVSVMKNLSVDCDCCEIAEDPCMKDIGILSSLDPVALDRACLDLIYKSKDKGRDHFVERVESRHGAHTIDSAEKLGFGTTNYELIEVE